MNFLFCPQNITHYENMAPVAEKLINSGHKVTFLNLDYIFNQKIDFGNFNILSPSLDYKYKKSFYSLGYVSKIKVAKKFWLFSKTEIVPFYDRFIFGNDGSLQRCIILNAKMQGKHSSIILDAMVSKTSNDLLSFIKHSKFSKGELKIFFKHQVANFSSKLFQNSHLGIYLPSKIAKTHVDKIFVTGQFTKDSIQSWNKKSDIVASGIPRYFFIEDTNFKDINHTLIYFLTTAYKWHGFESLHKAQQKSLTDLIDVINYVNSNYNKTFILRIKVHPRDFIEDYNHYNESIIQGVSKDYDLNEIYSDKSIVFTTVSSCIVEGLRHKKIVHSILINHPIYRYKESFIMSENISRIITKEQLTETILSEKKNTTTNSRLLAPHSKDEIITSITNGLTK